jgi:hypothetical protein
MEQRYKTLNIYPKDYERLQRLANGRPLGRQITLILDTIEKNGVMVTGIDVLPCPEGCQPVPLVTVDARSIERD